MAPEAAGRVAQARAALAQPHVDQWVYTLGLVELAVEGTTPVALRLTDLGRALCIPTWLSRIESTPAEAQTAWVVQPNFEIVVYLDRATPQQLAFLERHAERIQAQQHVAQYRLTREAVYAALESGSTLEKLLTTLETTWAGRCRRTSPSTCANGPRCASR